MKVNFDFYVGHAYNSDESGGWFIATITHSVAVAFLAHVSKEMVAAAEQQLRDELEAQGTDFTFIQSAGCNDATDYSEERYSYTPAGWNEMQEQGVIESAKKGELIAIVDEEQGGIIGYAIGESNAALITGSLNGGEQ